MDLAEWYAGKRWVGLLELIDNLPRAGRLNEAIANDPEMAAHLAELRLSRSDDADPWTPLVSEFDLHATMTQSLITEVKALRHALLSVNAIKPGEEKPFPSPRTEIDRAVESAERSWAVALAGQFGFTSDDI
ncbi:hypothetical protein [Arthrobacter sp. MP_2.3]|uniref:hypothetical protein n=1 Tax=Arthrobacter sp. MP_2.3 TaxID=3349633 RepID=UPI0038D3FFE5